MGPFPDFSDHCPLCGGKNCARFLQIYTRTRVIIGFKVYYLFPILRYICQGKGPNKPAHKTFSLLPHWLVPYYQHSWDMMFEVVNLHQANGENFTKTKDAFSALGKNEPLPLENRQIHNFMNIFLQAFYKTCTIPKLQEQMQHSGCNCPEEPLNAIFKFFTHYQSPLQGVYPAGISNPELLSLDFFYHWQSGDYFQRLFLFGTPSQKKN